MLLQTTDVFHVDHHVVDRFDLHNKACPLHDAKVFGGLNQDQGAPQRAARLKQP